MDKLINSAMQMLDSFQPMRETLRGLVAQLTDDGFTDEQAHAMIAEMWIASQRMADTFTEIEDEEKDNDEPGS